MKSATVKETCPLKNAGILSLCGAPSVKFVKKNSGGAKKYDEEWVYIYGDNALYAWVFYVLIVVDLMREFVRCVNQF